VCVRVGLRYVRGLREVVGKRIAEERAKRAFASIADLAARCELRSEELATLAEIGALAGLPRVLGGPMPTRRAALWQAQLASQRGPGMLARVEPLDEGPSPLPELDAPGRTSADLRGMGLTVGPHLVAHERQRLRKLRALSAAELPHAPRRGRVRVGGLVIVRQRPGSAKGMVFLSLEDETGIANIVVDPPTFERNRAVLVGAPLLLCEGVLEKYDGVTSLKADRFWSLARGADALPRSRDFH
jgi:error-prone DNA polymerase